MNIAIYGGSFDPPHIAHIQTIQVALQKLDIDKLIVIVAYQNPLKKPCLFEAKKRYKWMKQLSANLSKVEVSDMEILQKKPIPSIESVLHIKNHLNPKKIFFIIGEDNLSNLHKWKRYEELKNLVEFVLIERYGYDANADNLCKISLPDVKYKISSTQIREGLSLGYLPDDLPEEIKLEVIKSYKELN
ncbi:nicotinate (nicotinamide) nucleotide adenylyltransferase [Helicobacter cappadocius]|uniref:Probable nicotinate-nucleotide adenylyltransferase n=1 Tax=Helicobacter cappadocius TaxID=3063998 RepID=A0AA90PJX9_9HELI|nr:MULTISPECIES: nicotinate (nicotinamide) nucleotide adenylyltransferase [unclassified Helicobacter]MDO7253700.1 nicotinate (nicotinamide) nucleotide adenylyltransferase [Helicobacter sp. faydin-H75]MDP2539612.1 nicotinate (nicotinamide) nucleotide adenylyltransferase [Helicobacter sp. faydin-H76]